MFLLWILITEKDYTFDDRISRFAKAWWNSTYKKWSLLRMITLCIYVYTTFAVCIVKLLNLNNSFLHYTIKYSCTAYKSHIRRLLSAFLWCFLLSICPVSDSKFDNSYFTNISYSMVFYLLHDYFLILPFYQYDVVHTLKHAKFVFYCVVFGIIKLIHTRWSL